MVQVLIRQIRELLQRSWRVELLHVYREGKQVADALARLRTLGSLAGFSWESPPASVSMLLFHDVIKVAFFRDVVT